MKSRIPLIVLCLVFLPGWTMCERKKEVTKVPVAVEGEVSKEKPGRPGLASENLNITSSQDDVVKAAISDVKSLKSYSEKLERLLK